MGGKTIVKIVFLIIMTICAVISVIASPIAGKRDKSGKRKEPQTQSRTVVRIRMACFLLMLICLFVCVVI